MRNQISLVIDLHHYEIIVVSVGFGGPITVNDENKYARDPRGG